MPKKNSITIHLLDIPADTIEDPHFTEEPVRNEDNENAQKGYEKESMDDLWTEMRDAKGIDAAIPQHDKGTAISDELNDANVQVSVDTEVIEAPAVSERKEIKVSTACGPSPDREIEEIFSGNEKTIRVLSPSAVTENSSRLSKVSIGTSPPPQSASTQVGEM